MSARTKSIGMELATLTIPTVPATASSIKSRGGHVRDRHLIVIAVVRGCTCP